LEEEPNGISISVDAVSKFGFKDFVDVTEEACFFNERG
jgi:hypothetical protein